MNSENEYLMHQSKAYILVIMILLCIQACAPKVEELKLNKTRRIQVDSIVNAQKDSLYLSMTQICDRQYDSLYNHMSDSLLTAYQAEIQKLIE